MKKKTASEADVEGHVLQISVIPSAPWVIDKTSPISGSARAYKAAGEPRTKFRWGLQGLMVRQWGFLQKKNIFK